MMIKIKELSTTVVSVFTGTYALANIQDVLSIIILILSIDNILYNLGYRIYNRIKSKEFDKIDDDIENSIDELNDLKKKESDE